MNKYKRIFIFIFMLLLPNLYVSANTDIAGSPKIVRNVSIEIEADNLFDAVSVVNLLPGYNSTSDVSFYNPDISRRHGYAHIIRRIGINELEHAQGILRDIGRVTAETENRRDLSSEHADLTIYAHHSESEIARLRALMTNADTLENIVFIESRISQLDRTLDTQLGRLREIDAQTREAYINITINSYEPFVFIPNPETFFDRLSRAFNASINFSRRFFEGTVVLIARLIVPLLIYGAIVFLILLIVKSKSKTKPIKAEDQSVTTDPAQDIQE